MSKNSNHEAQTSVEKVNLTTYANNLEDVIDVLIGVTPTDPETWDQPILKAIREVSEIKYYFLNQI